MYTPELTTHLQTTRALAITATIQQGMTQHRDVGESRKG